MTTSKAGAGGTAATTLQQQGKECCMCGDFGLSTELFKCKVCQFRSQHRYCSNQYPKAEAYRICNWCLKDEPGDYKTQNSFNSSSSNRTNTSDQDDVKITKKKNGNLGSLRKGTAVKLHDINKNSIKKQRSPERLPLLAARKRITTTTTTTTRTTTRTPTTSDAMEDKLRRTKSEEISNGGNGKIRKPVFRNKVRRYKLLDEVSSL